MTRILLDPARDLPDGGTGPIALTATLLDAGRSVAVFGYTVTDASTIVDLPAPDADAAWRLTVRRPTITIDRWNIARTDPGRILAERIVHFPDAPDGIAWDALTDIDPTTLQPPTGSPLLDAALNELRTQVLAARDSLVLPPQPSTDRPSPVDAGAGAIIFDTDLGCPLWSDGTTWRALGGTPV